MRRLGLGVNGRAGVLTLCISGVIGAQPTVRAQLTGTVFDSVAMRPLTGAIVRIVRADDPSIGRSTQSDSVGRFVYDSVAAGVWLTSFGHPVLDSLRLEPGVVRVDISEPGTLEVPLSLPSSRTLVAAACGRGTSAEFGVLVGTVQDAETEESLAGATIELRWPEWVLAKKRLVTNVLKATAVTDSLGRYLMCGVPTGSTLLGVSWRDADSTGQLELVIPADGYAVYDFALGRPLPAASRAAASSDSVAANPSALGAAVVRGRVKSTDGRALPNAIVRVLGTGTQVRTNAAGEFAILDAGSGTRSIEARAIGFQPHRVPVLLRASAPAQVTLILAVQSVLLDTVRVVAGREMSPEVLGIERRWRAGLGRHMNAVMIRERASSFVTDALRGMAGVSVRQQERGYGQEVLMRGFGGNVCAPQVFIDGLRTSMGGTGAFTIDDFVSLDNIAAVEVYARANLVPPDYTTMAGGCGVVTIWTKYATGGVPIQPPKSDRR